MQSLGLQLISAFNRGGGMYLRLGEHWWWCVCKHAHTRGVWGHAPPKFLKWGALRSLLWSYSQIPLVRLECMVGVILLFNCHDTHQYHEAFQSLLYSTSWAWWGGHLIDELTTWTRTVSTLYFTLKTEGRRLALAVCMHNSIAIVIVWNARVQDPRWALLIIYTQAYLHVPGQELGGGR